MKIIANKHYFLKEKINDILHDTMSLDQLYSFKNKTLDIPSDTIFIFKQHMIDGYRGSARWEWYYLPKFKKYLYAHDTWGTRALKPFNISINKLWRGLASKMSGQKESSVAKDD